MMRNGRHPQADKVHPETDEDTLKVCTTLHINDQFILQFIFSNNWLASSPSLQNPVHKELLQPYANMRILYQLIQLATLETIESFA